MRAAVSEVQGATDAPTSHKWAATRTSPRNPHSESLARGGLYRVTDAFEKKSPHIGTLVLLVSAAWRAGGYSAIILSDFPHAVVLAQGRDRDCDGRVTAVADLQYMQDPC